MNNSKLNISEVILIGSLSGAPKNIDVDSLKSMAMKFLGNNLSELFINPWSSVSIILKKIWSIKWYLSSHLVNRLLGVRQASTL